MSIVYRRHIPLAITFICGLVMILQYFLVPSKITQPHEYAIQYYGVALTNWANLLANFIIGFGLVNAVLIHSRRAKRAKTAFDRFCSMWLLFVMAVFIIVGSFGFSGLWYTPLSSNWDWLTNYVLNPLDSTMYASLIFYMASGCYRVFKARNVETTLLLIVGFLSLMASAPIFKVYAPWSVDFISWFSTYLAVGSYRAIQVSAALGAILLGIRTLIGTETGYLGRRD